MMLCRRNDALDLAYESCAVLVSSLQVALTIARPRGPAAVRSLNVVVGSARGVAHESS